MVARNEQQELQKWRSCWLIGSTLTYCEMKIAVCLNFRTLCKIHFYTFSENFMLFEQWSGGQIHLWTKLKKNKSISNFYCNIRKLLSRFRFEEYFTLSTHNDVTEYGLFVLKQYFTVIHFLYLPTKYELDLVPYR